MQVWATDALLIMVSEPLILRMPSLMYSVSVVCYVYMYLNRIIIVLYTLKVNLVIFFVAVIEQAYEQPNWSQRK